MRRVAKEGMVIGMGQVLVVASRFATVWWLTRALDPRTFGEVALLQGLAALGFSILCGALVQAGLRFQSEALNDGSVAALRALLKPLVMRSAWMTAGVLTVGALVWKVASGSDISGAAIVVGLVLIVPDATRMYEISGLNAARRQTAYSAWSVADAIARPIGAGVAISLFGRSALATLAGFCGAAIVVNLICARLFASPATTSPAQAVPGETRTRILRFAAPLVAIALMSWIVGLADRYVLAASSGIEAAGLYAAVYGVGSQGFLALGFFGLAVFRPLYFAAVDAGDSGKARRVLVAWLVTLAAGSLAGVAALCFVGGPIARICLGPDFQSGAPLLPWIGVAYALQTIQTVFEVLLYAKHRTAPLLRVQAAGAVMAMVLYAVLIPRYGALGAALATLGSFGVSCIAAAAFGDVFGALRASAGSAAPR